MKLCAIVNLWDGEELLPGALKRMMGHIDLVIIVYQVVSNFGEPHSPLIELDLGETGFDIIYHKFLPEELGGIPNERRKRNIGLDIARENNCTHFFHMDCDEYWEDFGAVKEAYFNSDAIGSVCPIYTYFKSPTWRLENMDGYFVPFIHRLFPWTQAGMSSYPFYCDPTRVINEPDIVNLEIPMHHFSWCRKDIKRKARNSSAGQHGNKLSGLLNDYDTLDINSDPTGYVIKDMAGQRLVVVDDQFDLQRVLFSV